MCYAFYIHNFVECFFCQTATLPQTCTVWRSHAPTLEEKLTEILIVWNELFLIFIQKPKLTWPIFCWLFFGRKMSVERFSHRSSFCQPSERASVGWSTLRLMGSLQQERPLCIIPSESLHQNDSTLTLKEIKEKQNKKNRMRLFLRIVHQQRTGLKLNVLSGRSCIQFRYYILASGKHYQFFW